PENMIELEIGGGSYKAPQSWDEITLKQFIAICGVQIPNRLLALYKASADLNTSDKKEKKAAEKNYDKVSEKITTKDLIVNFPKYYGEVIKILTDIPQEVIDQIDGESRTTFYDRYIRYAVLSTFSWQPLIMIGQGMQIYIPETIKSFKLEEKEFFLPETLGVYGEQIPMAREKIVSFAEASKIELELHNNNQEGAVQLPMLMAIYCRPEGEAYDEETIMKRTTLMEQLTMDKVWAVFFCINGLFRLYQNSIRGFTQGLTRLHKEHSTGKVVSTIMDGGARSMR
ncbi:hypothetical protein KA005_07820, partial [bacterium]|nr:hypothetical protein [bacterium]